eukprot:CAMPEP_0185177828 /NCGR_PEP_ID=MMETSP1139-20130426/30294_1 /TAXON_ID=298111 /ORGANISM="Pavlova sp., Strain CCMP459" /LENGTH=69 /DNA_ID=CAMNT_0027743631 /DNA_START=105 /DNA_END=310 /DNA_ORIENTATION=+
MKGATRSRAMRSSADTSAVLHRTRMRPRSAMGDGSAVAIGLPPGPKRGLARRSPSTSTSTPARSRRERA